MKRVVIVSDFHTGHEVGLTHPNYDAEPNMAGRNLDLFKQRREYYKFYKQTIEELKPIDVLICNGDLIDGRGERSGSTELIMMDRQKQCNGASAAILEAEAKSVFLAYGTPYHTGVVEDWENYIAEKVNAKDIFDHGFIKVNGLVIDFKHKVGSSSVPYGRFTQVAKERLWNMLYAEYEEAPKANLFIRSHVHYFNYMGGYGWMGCTTPALQGWGSKFGARQCSGTVDFGLIHLDVRSKNDYDFVEHILKSPVARREAVEV